MRRSVFVTAFGLAVIACGCGESRPLTAGDKPVEYWVQTLQDPEPQLRKKAATKLGNVGSADPTVVPALVGALKDRDAGVRMEVALALLRIGPAAQEAVPALTDTAQNDRDAKVRAYAAQAVTTVQGNN